MSNSAITGPVLSDVKRSPSGTAAAPSWSFVNSTATGMYLVSADVLGITTAGAQRVVVDASGNVGIGTGSPAARLNIQSIGNWSSFNFGKGLYVSGAAGATNPAIGISDLNGTNNWAINNSSGSLQFSTMPAITDSTTPPGVRMTLDASGNLLVGTTSGTIGGKVEIGTTTNSQVGYGYYYNAASPNGAGFYVNSPQSGTNTANWYAFYSRVAGADRFFVTGAGVISASNTSVQPIASDVNLKQDIVDYDKGLNEVLKMKPRYFSWKAEPDRKDIGFIAQEMDEALPGSMVENKDGNKTYRVEWYPILVKAIQEQQEIIGKLEARLAALESK
jgi:hypothetical protein